MGETREAAAERMRNKRKAQREAREAAKAAGGTEPPRTALYAVPDRPAGYVETSEDRMSRYFALLATNFEPVWASVRAGIPEAEIQGWQAAGPKEFQRRMNEAKTVFSGDLVTAALWAEYHAVEADVRRRLVYLRGSTDHAAIPAPGKTDACGQKPYFFVTGPWEGKTVSVEPYKMTRTALN